MIIKKLLLYLVEVKYMSVIKRDGSQVKFDSQKIINAINKAFIEVDG